MLCYFQYQILVCTIHQKKKKSIKIRAGVKYEEEMYNWF